MSKAARIYSEEELAKYHARNEKKRFASFYDEIHFVVQIRTDWEYCWSNSWEDISKPYRSKGAVTKKLFELWKEAQAGQGQWHDSDGFPVYQVAIYDHDPREDGVFVGEISATLWAQLVSGLIAATKERRKVQI